MTIYEAIAHAEQKAREMRILSSANHEGVESCIKCAEEHEQLAIWLKKMVSIEDLYKNTIAGTMRSPSGISASLYALEFVEEVGKIIQIGTGGER